MVFKSILSSNLEVLKYFSLYSGLPTEAMTSVATLKVESLSLSQAVFKTYQKERGRPSQLKSRIKKTKQHPLKQLQPYYCLHGDQLVLPFGLSGAKPAKLEGEIFPCSAVSRGLLRER